MRRLIMTAAGLSVVICLSGFALLINGEFISADPASPVAVPIESSTPNRQPQKPAANKMNDSNHQTKLTVVEPGMWGGQGIVLNVEEKGATISYDCAAGEITDRLAVDKGGQFAARGFHTQYRPGPIRENDPPQRRPATYSGQISDDSMTLKVKFANDGGLVGEYKLERGKSVRLHRCL